MEYPQTEGGTLTDALVRRCPPFIPPDACLVTPAMRGCREGRTLIAMINLSLSALSVLMLCAAFGNPWRSAAPLTHQPGALSVQRLAWMSGCWQQRSGTRVTEEQWMRPAGGAMLGMNRTVSGSQMRAWESLRIVEQNGRAVYIAQPNGGPPTSFAASVVNDTLVVFDNPAHDFPQRIAYRRISSDSLHAIISAVRDGKTQQMGIPMERIACQ